MIVKKNVSLLNIDKQKEIALFTKPTLTSRNKELSLQKLLKETETKSIFNKSIINNELRLPKTHSKALSRFYLFHPQ